MSIDITTRHPAKGGTTHPGPLADCTNPDCAALHRAREAHYEAGIKALADQARAIQARKDQQLRAATYREAADLIEHWHGQAPEVYSPQDSAALLRHVANGGDPKSTEYPTT